MIKKIVAPLITVIAFSCLAYAAVSPELMLDSKIDSMKEAGVGPVRFTHEAHAKRAKCAVCHPKIFKEKRNTSGITMKGNMDDLFCGSPNCHSTKAFPLFECAKCHTKITAK